MLSQEEKSVVIKEYGQSENDTGSTIVQIALLTKEIVSLQAHMKTHKKDYSTQRGLMQKVNDRKSFLKYLQKTKGVEVYKDVITRLGIRK